MLKRISPFFFVKNHAAGKDESPMSACIISPLNHTLKTAVTYKAPIMVQEYKKHAIQKKKEKTQTSFLKKEENTNDSIFFCKKNSTSTSIAKFFEEEQYKAYGAIELL